MLKRLPRLCTRLIGWRIVGDGPSEPRSVLIASPHTSNWDLLFMMLAAGAWDTPLRWLGKEQLFRAWYGPLMHKLGGIPVYRESANGMVEQMAAFLEGEDHVALAIPASGTRSWTPHWKSGFYRIALAADVPVVPAYVDYGTRTIGTGEAVKLSGDVVADMDVFRAFYADKRGKFPEQDGPVVLLEELADAS